MHKTTHKPQGMTPSRFSAMMNCDRHELSRKLEEIKAAPIGKKNGGQVFELRDLILAFSGGDERAERIRRTRAEAERLEISNARSKGELVAVAVVKKLGERIMAAVKARIENSPLSDADKDKCLRDLCSLKNQKWDF